jgi:hypothetical protein
LATAFFFLAGRFLAGRFLATAFFFLAGRFLATDFFFVALRVAGLAGAEAGVGGVAGA